MKPLLTKKMQFQFNIVGEIFKDARRIQEIINTPKLNITVG